MTTGDTTNIATARSAIARRDPSCGNARQTRIEYVIDEQNRRVGKKVCAAPCMGGATAQLQQGFLYADQLCIVARRAMGSWMNPRQCRGASECSACRPPTSSFW